ncbi:MAG: hypothetical protein E7256_09545 [Lachnospiraceae bacterium]|nr:hypothetical protein [Lachnospiraceae bacterium]
MVGGYRKNLKRSLAVMLAASMTLPVVPGTVSGMEIVKAKESWDDSSLKDITGLVDGSGQTEVDKEQLRMPVEIDGNDKLSIMAVGQKLKFSHADTVAKLSKLSNMGYFVFEATEDFSVIEADIEVSEILTGNDNGILFGVFDDADVISKVASIMLRGSKEVKNFLSKNTGSLGTGGISTTFTENVTIHLTITRTATGIESTVQIGDTVSGKTYQYKDFEGIAANIVITKKSYDTVYRNSAILEGIVEKTGILELEVNGIIQQTEKVNAREGFSLCAELAEGRNDVNLYFTDANGKKTKQTYNFVYLTNYDIVVDASYTGENGAAADGVPVYNTVQAAVDAVPSGN